MQANPNWARWIFASVADRLKQVAIDENLPVVVDGLDERDTAFLEAPHRVEVRINGPFLQPLQGHFRLWVDANVLVTSHMDGDTKSRHEMYRIAGIYQSAMTAPIQVWNYGNEPGDYQDAQVFIGCLRVRPGRNDYTKLFNFGQIEKTDRVKQAIVDARYELFIEG